VTLNYGNGGARQVCSPRRSTVSGDRRVGASLAWSHNIPRIGRRFCVAFHR
jgi:hypothetical protein